MSMTRINDTMTVSEALDFLRARFADVGVELHTAPDGYVNGYTFKVSRAKQHVVGAISKMRIELWAEGIAYDRAKRAARRAA